MNREPLVLPRNCGNCRSFDGDKHCALETIYGPQLIPGYIPRPDRVVCAKHEPKDADDVEGAAV